MKQMILCLLLPLGLTAQPLPDSLTAKIDSIFRSYTAATPGCAVAVTRHSEVIFQKGYGMANLEYAAPITPQTIFHIASESKQYVAFCMLLLEKEGKLSLDDDIRKHLDYVPDFGDTITIRHLIYHTSGLRDQWQLLACAGWQLDDVITQEQVIRLVAKQKALNFTPGDEWMYCNTGYTLMAEIVKKVSGLSLRDYCAKYIFEPLGMKDTHFHDNYTELVPGRAYSYNMSAGGNIRHAVLSYSIVGATSLFTTVLDEVKWLNNLNTGAVGGKDLVKKMLQTGTLNDGRKLNYAFALNIGEYKGWRQIGHGGADAGFRTYACRFPEKELGIVVFSNAGNANVMDLTNRIAALLITDTKETPKPVEEIYTTDSIFLKQFIGRYYTERGDRVELSWQNGQLNWRNANSSQGVELKLRPEGPHRYKLSLGSTMVLDPRDMQRDSLSQFTVITSTFKVHFKRQPPVAQAATADFAGRYYNPETEAFYTITFKDNKLTLEHRKHASLQLQPIAPDQFMAQNWWMGHLHFLRNKRGKIIAFEVNANRVQHLRFDKVAEPVPVK